MKNLLLAHVALMQRAATNYLTPDSYTPTFGHEAGVTAYAEGDPNRDGAFIGDMIYALDGPEQRAAQEWASFDYIAESERTAPPPGHFNGRLIDAELFFERLRTFIEAAAELDRYKKLMFYGEDFNKKRFADPFVEGGKRGDRILEGTVNMTIDGPWLGDEQAEQVIHAVLGIASEAGEVAEALFNVAARGHEGDRVNFLEEVGDLQWYEAMLARVFSTDFDAIQRTNIAKLRERFPDKFTQDAANNRNLGAERAVLEAGAGEPAWNSPEGQDARSRDLMSDRAQTQFEGLRREPEFPDDPHMHRQDDGLSGERVQLPDDRPRRDPVGIPGDGEKQS